MQEPALSDCRRSKRNSLNTLQCGFSNAVVQILDHYEVEYAAYNVLEDPELREGVKKFR